MGRRPLNNKQAMTAAERKARERLFRKTRTDEIIRALHDCIANNDHETARGYLRELEQLTLGKQR